MADRAGAKVLMFRDVAARLAQRAAKLPRVHFNRDELMALTAVYSRAVAAGEWRDYAIDSLRGMARFLVFRSSQDAPAFIIVKTVKGRGPEAPVEYMVFGDKRGGALLRKGTDLTDVLSVLDKGPRLVRV